jgi:hypothetical protein
MPQVLRAALLLLFRNMMYNCNLILAIPHEIEINNSPWQWRVGDEGGPFLFPFFILLILEMRKKINDI